MPERVCAACRCMKDRCEYSSSQWSQGLTRSRCYECVNNRNPVNVSNFNTARENLSESAGGFSYWATGSYRIVEKGFYIGGQRNTQPCVRKYFQASYNRYSQDFYEADLKIIDRAIRIVAQFNYSEVMAGMQNILVNKPSIMRSPDGMFYLLEPFINRYEKFNSSTGWVSPKQDHWTLLMQALSHFSYHTSSGMFTLCDLQGGTNARGQCILTDPVIHSQQRQFGVTDLGRAGIITFFANHECNEYCQHHWTRPRQTTQYYPLSSKTHMVSRPVSVCDSNDYCDEDSYGDYY